MNIKLGNIMSILLVLMCGTGLSVAAPTTLGPIGTQATIADFTEGGHLETDFGVNFMAEWWYLNGDVTLVSSDGKEKRDLGFFVVLAHQESPMFVSPYPPYPQLSHLLAFYGLYDNGTTTFNYTEIYVPQTNVSDYIALGTPYVDYRYPDGLKRFNGSALTGYDLNYTSGNMTMDMFFQTDISKTIDQADEPLNFTTYEHSYGTLTGSIFLDGERYDVTHGEGYMDHMIPITNSGGTWPMDMHGWSWFEVTTKKYQAVAYAVRGLGDGYDDYSYKHLTLLNKINGKVIAEYSGDEVTITETGWIGEDEFNRQRPSIVEFSTPDMKVTINPENVVDFNQSDPTNATGFVDFMAFQPDGAAIQYNNKMEEGSAFYEYLVSDMGVIIFEMPELGIEKEYTYDITYDLYGRQGTEAMLYWGDKATIDGENCHVSKIEKSGGEEIQYLVLDAEEKDISLKGIKEGFYSITFMDLIFTPASLFIDYPLWDGKEWDRDEVNFSGTVWMGVSQPVVNVSTSGSSRIIGEEYVAVPAGIAHCLVLETTMTSSIVVGREQVNTQKIWLMENGFFAKRQLYHGGEFIGEARIEELELKEPILAEVDIKPETLNFDSKEKFTASIELPYDFDVTDIDLTTVECEGARAVAGYVDDNKLIVGFKVWKVDVPTGNTALLIITGKFDDETCVFLN